MVSVAGMLAEGRAETRSAPVTSETLIPGRPLLAAIRMAGPNHHPVTRLARELVTVHRRLRSSGTNDVAEWIKSRRMRLIHAIDLVVEESTPQHRRGPVMHTETVGQVIDRLVVAYLCANDALASRGIGDPHVHAAWNHLAELIDGYNDLRRDVMLGRRRLPTPADC